MHLFIQRHKDKYFFPYLQLLCQNISHYKSFCFSALQNPLDFTTFASDYGPNCPNHVIVELKRSVLLLLVTENVGYFLKDTSVAIQFTLLFIPFKPPLRTASAIGDKFV